MLSKGCFDWMKEWKTCPLSTIAGIHELYQQLLPPKLYHHNKMGTNPSSDVLCRMWGSGPESVPHILAGCSTLAKKGNCQAQCSFESTIFRAAQRSGSEFNNENTTMVLASAAEAHVRERTSQSLMRCSSLR